MRWFHLLPLVADKKKQREVVRTVYAPPKVFPQLGDPRTFVNEFTIILTLYQHGL